MDRAGLLPRRRRGQRLADVYTFDRGTPIEMRAFADRQQAMEWTEDTPPP
jgi:hypothetical protein